MENSNIISRKIVGYSLVDKEEATPDVMAESIKRPEKLIGSTYKIKTPHLDSALYITINDIILNIDTAFESRHPYEIFINTKNVEHFQWVIALTRVISAVFRKGGDIEFLIEELKAVFDPRGGYFKRGGIYMPSLVAEIGTVIDTHMTNIGLIQKEDLSEHSKAVLEEKRKEYEDKNGKSSGDFPDSAVLCNKCNTKAVIKLDGCMTCLNCGDSKCG